MKALVATGYGDIDEARPLDEGIGQYLRPIDPMSRIWFHARRGGRDETPFGIAVRLAFACAVLSGCRSTAAPPAPAPPAVVVAPPLVMRLTEWDEYTGRFEATDRVDVRARVDGYLDSIHFRDGAIVKPGDLLFVIDPRPYEAVLEGARADVVRAQTRVELTTTDFTRGEALFAIRGISQEEFDRRAQAQKEADAALIVARAAERVAALNVEFTRVRAPIGGRISQNFVSVGNVVSAARPDRRC